MMRTIQLAGAIATIGLLVAGCGDGDIVDGDGMGGTAGDTATGGNKATGGNGSGGDMQSAMPRGANNPPTLGMQIDRVGRPAITTALVGTFMTDETERNALKDSYNRAMPAQWTTFKSAIESSLAVLDGLDENCGNQLVADQTEDRYAFLAGVLADDQLYVLSNTGECGVYLGLEAEIVGALAAGGGKCGGRMLPDDVIERSYSVLAAGVLSGVDDTVVDNDKPFMAAFPFLAEPF